MEGIFIGVFKRTVLPKIKDVIQKWGQVGLDKAVLEDISMLDLIKEKDPRTYNSFNSLYTKLSPLKRYMYKWDSDWNARVLISVLEKDGIYFTIAAKKWLVKQLSAIKTMVYGDENLKNKQWLHARYVTKTAPDDSETVISKINTGI